MKMTAVACLLSTWPAVALAQGAQVEIDHVFVFVSPGGTAEAEALAEVGFLVDPAVAKHAGVGTASRHVLFENAYLELIWLDEEVPVAGDNSGFQRAASWRESGASPFGLALRRVGGEGEYGVPAISYAGEWMEPGSSIEVLKQPSEPDAFVAFVVPEYMAIPAWIEEVKQESPEVLAHSSGARRLTGVEIHGPAGHRALAARSLQIPGLLFVEAGEPLLVLELDGGAQGVTHDLRPTLPLLIRR
jgi:hypothetical protein